MCAGPEIVGVLTAAESAAGVAALEASLAPYLVGGSALGAGAGVAADLGGTFETGAWTGTGLEEGYNALPNLTEEALAQGAQSGFPGGQSGVNMEWNESLARLPQNIPDAAASTGVDPLELMRRAGNPQWTGAQNGMNWTGGVDAATTATGVNPMNFIQELRGGPIGQLQSMYSGWRGLQAADQMMKLSQMSGQTVDPWGMSGGRGAAAQQLQGVVNGGSAAYQNTPAYQARLLAAQRQMAAQGYNGSGNAAVAAAAAGGAGYNDYVAQMGQLAGVGNGGQAGQLQLAGAGASADLTSRALASLAYGTTRGLANQVPGNDLSGWGAFRG